MEPNRLETCLQVQLHHSKGVNTEAPRMSLKTNAGGFQSCSAFTSNEAKNSTAMCPRREKRTVFPLLCLSLGTGEAFPPI